VGELEDAVAETDIFGAWLAAARKDSAMANANIHTEMMLHYQA